MKLNSKKQIVLSILVSLLFQAAAFAKKQELCNFIPKNDLNIPAGMELMGGGIDESTFNKVIDHISSYYAPIIEAKGGKLKINRLWKDGTVNASAQRLKKNWIVNMYGGLARYTGMTEDGFALVLCHEFGHHLGGFPQSVSMAGTAGPLSDEGQADYFSTMKCFRRVYENADNASAISAVRVSPIIKEKCTNSFKSTKEINLCIREILTGQTLSNVLQALENEKGISVNKTMPSIETPDPSIVKETSHAHPHAQCRFDTYIAGAICPISYAIEFGEDNPLAGACALEKGDRFGYRPLCWYKPQ